MVLKSRCDMATSAIWNVTYRAWVTTLAPILIGLSLSVVNDQCFTPWGSASLRRRLPKLYAKANPPQADSRTWLSTKS